MSAESQADSLLACAWHKLRGELKLGANIGEALETVAEEFDLDNSALEQLRERYERANA
jgi:hypothetical protein